MHRDGASPHTVQHNLNKAYTASRQGPRGLSASRFGDDFRFLFKVLQTLHP